MTSGPVRVLSDTANARSASSGCLISSAFARKWVMNTQATVISTGPLERGYPAHIGIEKRFNHLIPPWS